MRNERDREIVEYLLLAILALNVAHITTSPVLGLASTIIAGFCVCAMFWHGVKRRLEDKP